MFCHVLFVNVEAGRRAAELLSPAMLSKYFLLINWNQHFWFSYPEWINTWQNIGFYTNKLLAITSGWLSPIFFFISRPNNGQVWQLKCQRFPQSGPRLPERSQLRIEKFNSDNSNNNDIHTNKNENSLNWNENLFSDNPDIPLADKESEISEIVLEYFDSLGHVTHPCSLHYYPKWVQIWSWKFISWFAL